MKTIIVLTGLAFLSSCSNKVDSSSGALTRPNIILIVVDDQGYADFGPFDESISQSVSPNISALANSGIRFAEAYVTAPVCSPSRVGLLTGKNQFRWDKNASWGPGLPDSVKTIPEYLKDIGYATARIGKSDLGRNFHKYNVREYPLEHGYDEFLGFSAHAHDYWHLSNEIRDRTKDPKGTSAVLGPLMHNNGEKGYDEGYLTDILTDEAISYIEEERSSPFFLTLSYSAVHHLIHEVPQRYLEKYDVAPIANYEPDSLVAFGKHEPGTYLAYYDKYSRLGPINATDMRKYYLANLNSLDDNIGRFLSALEKNGLTQKTMIIFISDNGGSPLTGADNTPLTGGKYSLWEGGIRVPMSISWPSKIAPKQVRTDYVSATDILPTIGAAVGVEMMDPTIDGINLLSPIPDRLLVWKWQKTWAVRQGDWKLTNTNENHWKSDPSNAYIVPIRDDLTLKLFNLKDDPGERHDLASEYPERVSQLEAAYEDWITQHSGVY